MADNIRRFFNRRMKWENVATPASQYLVSDDLEYVDVTAATAGGWTSASTPVWGYNTSPAPLQGSYSLAINSSSDSVTKTFASSSTVYCYFLINLTAFTANQQCFYLLDSLDAQVAAVMFRFATQDARCFNGTTNATSSSGLILADTTYHVWVDYTVGSGANGITNVYVSTTGIKGSAIATVSNGNATTNAEKIRFGLPGGIGTDIIDKVRVSLSPIGDNPS